MSLAQFDTVPSIDNPPVSAESFDSAIGKAINHLQHGRRVPYDLAVELMEDGYDLPSLTAQARANAGY